VNFGTSTIRELRQILIKDENGKIHPIPVPETMDTPVDLKRAIKQKGLIKYKLFSVLCEKHELKHIEHILSELIPPNKKIVLLEPKTSGCSIPAKVQSIITEKYFRAIAKIGFHYFLKQFPRFSGSEREFEPIRKFIKSGIGNIESFVNFNSGHIIKDFARGLTPKNFMHILAIDKNHKVIVKIQFFLGPWNMPGTWVVNIGMNPSKILFTEGVSHCYVYFDSKTKGFDGEMSKVVTSRYIAAPG